jgi:hypothetical protein
VVVIGLWLGTIGYGVLYAGVQKLGGATCSLGQAFRGQCGGTATTAAATSGSGTTLLASQQGVVDQQMSTVPTIPIASGAA